MARINGLSHAIVVSLHSYKKSAAQAKIGLCGALFLLGQRLMISLRRQQTSYRCSNHVHC